MAICAKCKKKISLWRLMVLGSKGEGYGVILCKNCEKDKLLKIRRRFKNILK